jgi:hypothetical protein
MSVNLPQLYAQQFATNVVLLLQQKGSKLRGKVNEMKHYGEQASPVDQIGAIEMTEVTTRFEAMGRVDAAVDRRWVLPQSFDLPQLVDSFDELKMLTDPKSKYVENATYAAGRKMDSIINSAFFGAANTGKSGTTSTVFPTATQQVAQAFGAASAVGMTVAKLRRARQILMANEVDLESDEIFAVMTARQIDDLLSEIQVTSRDFNGDAPVLTDGKLTRFLGMNIVHYEGLTLSTYRQCAVYAKSGMHLGVWGDVKTDVDQRKDLKGLPWQAYLTLTIGATRIEEKKVVQVLCSEA